jgi:hypothetical protein
MQSAKAEGKALDHICERVICMRGVKDILVEQDVPVRQAFPGASLLVVTDEPCGPETRSQLNHVLLSANRRFGTGMRARIIEEQGLGLG